MTGIIDVPKTHEHLREIRAVLDSYPGERTSVGEVFLLDPAQVAKYYGDDDELHLSFNFAPLFSRWRAASWARNVRTASEVLDDAGHWATWVLSNHDNPRHRTRYGGDERIARAAAVLLLTLRGTPFLYAGEELGLEDADRAAGAPRRSQRRPSRRLPGPDPVDGGAGARVGHRRHVAAVPAGARRAATRRRCATTPARSCTCTATCSPFAGGRPRSSSARSRCSSRRRTSSSTSAASATTSARSRSASATHPSTFTRPAGGRAVLRCRATDGAALDGALRPYEAVVLRAAR